MHTAIIDLVNYLMQYEAFRVFCVILFMLLCIICLSYYVITLFKK